MNFARFLQSHEEIICNAHGRGMYCCSNILRDEGSGGIVSPRGAFILKIRNRESENDSYFFPFRIPVPIMVPIP